MPLPITPAPTTTARSIFNPFPSGGPAGDATWWRCTARPPRAPTVPALALTTYALNLPSDAAGHPTAPHIPVLHVIPPGVAPSARQLPPLPGAPPPDPTAPTGHR